MSKVLETIRNLIAQAESTTFEEEASSFMAKAQQLMSKHSIEMAMIGDANRDRGLPTSREIIVKKPYASQAWTLLSHIAKANRCVTVGSGDARSEVKVTIVGFEEDIDNTEMLFTSLRLQSSFAMAIAPVPSGTSAKSFRSSFLLGYASRVGSRLEEARKLSEEEEELKYQGASVSLVLRNRKSEVDDKLNEMFPRLRSRSTSIGSNEGYGSGHSAAGSADIGNKSFGSTKALSQ